MSLSEMVAKRRDDGIFQSLEGHTKDALSILKDYLKEHKKVLTRLSADFEIEEDLFLNLVFLSLYLHDVGKLTCEFQYGIQNGKNTGSCAHPFFGLPFINSTLPKELEIILKLSVLSHHSQLYNQIYQHARLKTRLKYALTEIKDWVKKCNEAYQDFSSLFELKHFPKYEEPGVLKETELNEAIKDKVSNLRHQQMKSYRNEKTKAIYSVVLAILKHCDQKASKNFEELNLETKGIYGSLIEEEDARKFNYSRAIFKIDENKLWPRAYEYQNKSSAIDFCGLIFAPCGRGKTEAAIWAALNIIKQEERSRLIFALPTQITSNAMYQRMQGIFGQENVGIYHGLSRFVHETKEELPDENIKEIIREERVFNRPVTVTTIDHLFYSLVHGYTGADFSLGNILTSVIIFDEIHYYEKRLLRYIIDAIKILKKLKVPHIAMSGTFPDFLIEKLNATGSYKLIEDKEGLTFKPFIIKRKKGVIYDAVGKIVEFYKKGKNQIVIVNTVKRAQKIYEELLPSIKEEDRLILYHSIFTHYDRAYSKNSKETKIFSLKSKRPWIIVSTQAIEISVDISTDIMHTELAPVDAIGQRGGRLNRGGRCHNNSYIMYLYEVENHKPYYVDGMEDNFVEMTNPVITDGEISYQVIKEWCDRVYSNVTLLPTDLEEIFRECILFGYHPSEIRYSEEEGNRLKIRGEERFLKVDAIPEKYWQKENLRDNHYRTPIFEAKVPYFWYKKYPEYFYLIEDKFNKHLITTIPYSKEYGFNIDKLSKVDESCLIC